MLLNKYDEYSVGGTDKNGEGMRKKDELAIDKILECAKKEFTEKGFEGGVDAFYRRKRRLHYGHAVRQIRG